MRLAQLARKLIIRPSVIVDFLATQNIQIEDGLNARLNDEHVTLIMQKFAPERIAEVAAELLTEKKEETATGDFVSERVDDAATLMEAEIKEPETSSPDDASSTTSEKPELIKVQRVELSGLKVLGKIELPQPKKKEPEALAEGLTKEQTQTPESPAQPASRNFEKRTQENRKPRSNKRESDSRPKVNPVALQREREAQEAEKRRRAQAKLEKEKRTQHYHKKIKTVAPTKSVKLVREEVEEMTPLAPAPKTWWGKFIKWLNT